MADEARLIYWLARVARETRLKAGLRQEDVGAARGRKQDIVSKFEQGNTWPRNPEVVIDAYARATGRPAQEIWSEAIRRWRAAGAVCASGP